MTGSPPPLPSGLHRPAQRASRRRRAKPRQRTIRPGLDTASGGEIPADIAELTTGASGFNYFGNKSDAELEPADSLKKRYGVMKRCLIAAAKINQKVMQSRKARYRVAFITLTYARCGDWRPNDIARLLDCYYQWAKRRGFQLRGIWKLELQQRGAEHYHLVLWLPRGVTPPKPDKQGWWTHGHSRCEWAYSPVGYVAKYASKKPGESGQLPKGARLFGVFGCLGHLGWYRAPKWLRDLGKPGQHIARGQQGWWLNRSRGWCFRSPWEFLCMRAGKAVISWKGWRPPDIMTLFEYEHQLEVT